MHWYLISALCTSMSILCMILWIFLHIIEQTCNKHPITRFLNFITTLSSLVNPKNISFTCDLSQWCEMLANVRDHDSLCESSAFMTNTITTIMSNSYTSIVEKLDLELNVDRIYLQCLGVLFSPYIADKKCFTQGSWRVSYSGIWQQKPLTFKRTPPTWRNMVQRPKTELNKIIGWHYYECPKLHLNRTSL